MVNGKELRRIVAAVEGRTNLIIACNKFPVGDVGPSTAVRCIDL